jgi:hypothetical protein
MSQATEPVRIRELNLEAQGWFAVLAGMQLDLFTPLADGPLRAGELADAIGVDAAKLELLLYALVVARLLTVEDGRFANTEEADLLLVSSKPTYIGSVNTLWVEMAVAGLKTAESVRTGVPQARHDFAAMSEEELLVTLGGLHAQSLGAGRTLASRYDFSACRDVLDVAGGAGGLSIGLVDAYPDLRATIAELPFVLPVARRFIAEAGLSDRIETVAVDVVRDSVPGQYDAVVMRYFLQVLSVEDARAALRNVATSIRPGGAIYIIGLMLDDTRLAPAIAAMLNIQFLNFYEHGQAYTERHYRAWLTDAGLVDITRGEDMIGNAVIVARKPV